MNPEISVVIPFYNTEKYLQECLDSITKQTFGQYEVILVDDCGSDNSLEMAQKYALADERAKIVRHEKNKGLGAARNTGLREATGGYVTFLDSDDWIAPDALELEYRTIVSQPVESMWFDIVAFHEDTARFCHGRAPLTGLVPLSEDVLLNSPSSGCNKLYRRQFLLENALEFDEGILYEDLGFFFRFCVLSKRAYITNEPLYFYRRRAGSIMSTSVCGKGSCADIIESCRRCYSFLQERALLREYGDVLLHLYAKHFEQFLFSRFYKNEMMERVKTLLDEMDFANAFDRNRHPLFAAVQAYSGRKNNKVLYKTLSSLNKINPSGELRQKWRAWLRVNLLAR